jgi:uncharacterized membrane protein HdeD (DUF308 family)
MHLFEPRHFIKPFLAHALGTLAGALAAYLIAATCKAPIAYVIGAVFLCGGVAGSSDKNSNYAREQLNRR